MRKLAIIGVGNMAKSIVLGVIKSNVPISEIIVYDSNPSQYEALPKELFTFSYASCIAEAVRNSDCVLLAVKPQNYPTVLKEIHAVSDHNQKLYISIGAGITVQSVSESLSHASVIRVLPNLPMTIGNGVSVICKNPAVSSRDFEFVTSLFSSSGSTLLIEESDMNRIIGVTSSSPAYVFKFIDSIYKSAIAQGLSDEGLLDAVCDVFIGSALLLKKSSESPQELISRVASKGGTTEQALKVLNDSNIERIIFDAMIACTNRADELGASK